MNQHSYWSVCLVLLRILAVMLLSLPCYQRHPKALRGAFFAGRNHAALASRRPGTGRRKRLERPCEPGVSGLVRCAEQRGASAATFPGGAPEATGLGSLRSSWAALIARRPALIAL